MTDSYSAKYLEKLNFDSTQPLTPALIAARHGACVQWKILQKSANAAC